MKTATLLCTSLFLLTAGSAFAQKAGASAASGTQTSATAPGSSISGGSAASAAGSVAAPKASNAAVTQATGASAANVAGSAAASQQSSLAAELTHKVDSKNARVGDEIAARTTSATQLADGTKLPKGTRLIGKVTEVQPKSAAQHDAHLAFAFDRAVLRDGREVPIHATLQSISAPLSASSMASESDEFAATSAPIGVAGGASGSARGGLLGGGAAVPRTGLLSGATTTVAAAPSHVAGAAGTLTHTAGSTLGTAANRGKEVTGHTAAVISNLPGVTASESANGSSALDAKGNNVELSTGTQMMFSVAAQ